MSNGIIDLLSLLQGGVAAPSTAPANFVPLVFPLDLPSDVFLSPFPKPRQITFSQDVRTAVSESPYTGVQQLQVYSGQRWLVDVELAPIGDRIWAETWIAFLSALNGPENTFRLGDPLGTNPRGSALGSPVVFGTNQNGNLIHTAGWVPNVPTIIAVGDWLEIAGQLYKAINNSPSDSAGLAVLQVWPSIRPNVATNETIITQNTRGTFRLAATNNKLWTIVGSKSTPIYQISFAAVEAL
jgi:hypothetical protein